MGFILGLSKLLLISCATVGFLGTLKYSSDNGLFEKLNELTAAEKPTLPGSDVPMRAHWTGFEQVDETLRTFIAFFSITISGRSPTLTLQAVHFYGQGLATWLLMLVESYRVGNRWALVSFITIVGLLLENVAMAIVLPIWCVVHLVRSPFGSSSISPATRQTALLVHPTELQVLPWGLAIGCGIPSLMMLFCKPEANGPFYSSSQFWILARQIHPVFTFLSILFLSPFTSTKDTDFSSPTTRNRSVASALRKVFSCAKYLAIVSHCSTLTLALGSKIVPRLFTDEYRAFLDPVSVWLPAMFWDENAPKPDTVASGALLFLQWDEVITCLSILIWAFALNRDALTSHTRGSGILSTIWRVICMITIGGPAAAAVSLIEERDETLLETTESSAVSSVKKLE